MALIAMAVYDPPGECRGDLLFPCLHSLAKTVNFQKHRLFIINNGVCPKCLNELRLVVSGFAVQNAGIIGEGKNVGTARAINQAWKFRNPGENAVKVDSDVLIRDTGWVDAMEDAIAQEPRIGQIGLKRPDLAENPWAPEGDWSHSKLLMLPHKPGQRWLTVETVNHVMGTCVMHSAALLDKVGFLYQMGGVYGGDDADMSCRSQMAGFINCFLCNYHIEHPDNGDTSYDNWKRLYVGDNYHLLMENMEGYRSGAIPLHRGPTDE
jgi:GT2 family glycosyltransferase